MNYTPAKLLNLWIRMRHSLWLVPVLCTLGGAAVAFVMLLIDGSIMQTENKPFWLETTPQGAQTVLSTIAGGMITVAGVVLSMEMVTLSITSSQFGSRVLRSRIDDRTTHWTIGMFLGSGVYSLVVLNMTRETDNGHQFVPHLSVIGSILFALTSLIVLLYFVHHVAVIAQAPEIVSSLASDLRNSMDRLFPRRIGDPPADEESRERDLTDQEKETIKQGLVIRSKSEGYIQEIEGSELMYLAEKHDLVIQLLKRPGDFVSDGEAIARVAFCDKADQQQLSAAINGSFLVGSNRTPWQDVNCAVHELSQMGVRALSPGINDPYTAVNCIDRLSAALAQLAQRQMPSANRFDSQGNLRMIVDRTTFSSVMHAAFDQIRSNSVSSTAVSQRLMEGYLRIADAITDSEQGEDLMHQARLTIEGLLAQPHHPADLQIIQDQYEHLKEQLEQWLGKPSQAEANEDSDENEDKEGEASGEVIG